MGCPNFIWNNNPGATSAEFDNQALHPVVIFMPEISKTHMGGTMRLGLRPTVFDASTEEWSKARGLYGGAGKIWERHRHRYEVNPDYIDRLKEGGLEFMGKDEKGERMQFLELRGTYSLVIDAPGTSHSAFWQTIPSSLDCKPTPNSVAGLSTRPLPS